MGAQIGAMLRTWLCAVLVVVGASAVPGAAQAQDTRNWAPGFTGLSRDAKVVVAPIDVELFVISAGGMLEPKADWTAAAQRHMKAALNERVAALGNAALQMSEGAVRVALHRGLAGLAKMLRGSI